MEYSEGLNLVCESSLSKKKTKKPTAYWMIKLDYWRKIGRQLILKAIIVIVSRKDMCHFKCFN